MYNFNSLSDKGMVGLYSTFEDDTYVFILHFKDSVLYAVKSENTLLVPMELSSSEDFIIDSFEYFHSFFKVNKCRKNSVVSVDTSLIKIKSTINASKKLTALSDSIGYKDLSELGFDMTDINKKLSVISSVRDYTKLSSTIEGQLCLKNSSVSTKNISLPEKYRLVADNIKNGNLNLVYLVGPAGTGKSTLAHLFALHCGAPLLTWQGNEGVEKYDLVGGNGINADYDPDSTDNLNQYKLIIGQLLKAYINGYQLVIDEANFIVPGVMAVINSMTDNSTTYTFEGKTFERHPNFVLYLTSNPGYVGTYKYNPATKSRGIVLLIDKLSLDDFTKRMLIKSNQMLTAEFFQELYSFGEIIQEHSTKCSETFEVSIRQAEHLCRFILSESLSKDNFEEAIKFSYVYNSLAMDNDNSVSIRNLTSSNEYKAFVEKLYDLYPYKSVQSLDGSSNIELSLSDFMKDLLLDPENLVNLTDTAELCGDQIEDLFK